MMKKVITTLLCALLSGCAGFQQAVTGYQSAAATSMTAAEDNLIRAWVFQACATPYSAILRHPEIAPALVALCRSVGDTSAVLK